MAVIAPIIDRVPLLGFTSIAGERIDAPMLNSEILAYTEARGRYLNLEIDANGVSTQVGWDDLCVAVIKTRLDGYNVYFTHITEAQKAAYERIVRGLLSAV